MAIERHVTGKKDEKKPAIMRSKCAEALSGRCGGAARRCEKIAARMTSAIPVERCAGIPFPSCESIIVTLIDTALFHRCYTSIEVNRSIQGSTRRLSLCRKFWGKVPGAKTKPRGAQDDCRRQRGQDRNNKRLNWWYTKRQHSAPTRNRTTEPRTSDR